jgi:hypothetical protein
VDQAPERDPAVKPTTEPLESSDAPSDSNRENPIPEESDDKLEKITASQEYWGAHNPPPNIHVAIESTTRTKFVAAYLGDPTFGKIWTSPRSELDAWTPGNRYFKNAQGLLFFHDADYQP